MDVKAEMAEMKDQLRALYRVAGDQAQGYTAMQKSVHAHGVLGKKEKEFVALGIAIATRCVPCMQWHMDALVRAGATREEIADVAMVAVSMAGGPGMMYAAKALAIWDALSGADA